MSFYPRHPRGWRPKSLQDVPYKSAVSIHATLAGGDVSVSAFGRPAAQFLSTPPSRVATIGLRCVGVFLGISIHATLAGGDFSQ